MEITENLLLSPKDLGRKTNKQKHSEKSEETWLNPNHAAFFGIFFIIKFLLNLQGILEFAPVRAQLGS